MYFFFFKQGDEILRFQKYLDTCGLGLKLAFSLHKNAIYAWTKGMSETEEKTPFSENNTRIRVDIAS